jgi:hypothetical protein
LRQSTGEIADPVESESADEKIEASLAEWDKIGIGDDPHALALRQERERRVGGDNPFHVWSPTQRAGHGTVVDAEIECAPEWPADVVEALDEPVGDLGMKKVDASDPCRPVAMHPQGATIEECYWR